jgi:type II secretory pathway component PulF
MSTQCTVTAYDPTTQQTITVQEFGLPEDVNQRLIARGLKILNIEASSVKAGAGDNKVGGRLSIREQSYFFHLISVQVKCGMSIQDAIRFFAEGCPPKLRTRLGPVHEALERGEDVSKALGRTGLFNDDAIGMIAAGESSGALDKALARLGEIYDASAAYRDKTIKLCLMPSLTVGIGLLFLTAFALFMIPSLEGKMRKEGMKLNAAVEALFGLYGVLQIVMPLLLLAIIGLVLFAVFSPTFRSTLVAFFSSLHRDIRAIVMGMRQYRFLSSLHLLLENGQIAERAMPVAAESVRGTPMHDEIIRATRDLENGLGLATALRNHTSCDARTIHMIRIGEGSSLTEIIGNLCRLLRQETDLITDRASLKAQALSLFTAIGIVLFLIVSIYLPVLSMLVAQLKGSMS